MEETLIPVKDNGKPELPATRRRDPWTLFESLWSDFDFDRFAPLRPRLPRLLHRADSPMPIWRPDVDVFQKEGKLVVKADLPGMTKDNVQVLLEGGNLVIKGERVEESKIEEDNYFRAERSYGSFYRSIPLPPEIDESKIEALFEKGVLEVRVPLPAKQLPAAKQIAIK